MFKRIVKFFKLRTYSEFFFLPMILFKGFSKSYIYTRKKLVILRKNSPIFFYISMFCVSIPLIIVVYDYNEWIESPFNLKEVKAKKEAKELLKKSIEDIILCDEIKKSLIYFVNKLFNNEKVKEELLNAIINSVKDDIFLEETKVWSKEWIFCILKSNEFKYDLKENTLSILKSIRMKTQGANYAKEVVTHEITKELAARIIKEIWLRDSVLGELTFLFQRCGMKALSNNECKYKCSEMFLRIWSDNNFKNFMIQKSFNFWENNNKDIFTPSILQNFVHENNTYDLVLKDIVKNNKINLQNKM